MDHRYLTICFCLLIIFSQQKISIQAGELDNYGLEEAIDDISTFVPGAKVVLITALKLWHVYGELKQTINPNATVIEKNLKKIDKKLLIMSERLDHISNKLDNLMDNVKDVKNTINDKVIDQLPQQINLKQKLDDIERDINYVNGKFHDFIKYSKPKNKFQQETIMSFVHTVISHNFGELNSMLKKIHSSLIEKYSSMGINVLNILANRKVSYTMMCQREQSAQVFISHLYSNVMKAEIKGLMMTQFAYSVLKKKSKNKITYEAEIEDAKYEFFNRSIQSLPEVKRAMSVALREYWKCDPDTHIPDVTHATLGPIFQTYIISEKDAENEEYKKRFTNKCKDTCAERTHTLDLCRSSFCKQHGNKCEGFVRDCESHDYKLEICTADKDSGRRYNYIELHKKKQVEIYGKRQTCKEENKLKPKRGFGSIHHYLEKCEYCFCTCESTKADVDRYFNLKPVTSDVDKNKVITGIRFAKKNNIFHIQIQQGQLIKNGQINARTVLWKPVENYKVSDKKIVVGRDYHKISWDERTINLDTLEAKSTSEVLTGLKFKIDNHVLKIDIQVTPFDFASGKLMPTKSHWISESGVIDRSPIEFDEDFSLPDSGIKNEVNTQKNKYIKFTKSSLKTDIGQTVVPYIDLQNVEMKPPVPLSGAGVVFRGAPESAGFLALKVVSFNFAPYMGKKYEK